MFTWLGLAILFIAAIVLLLVENPGGRIDISDDDFARLAQGIALLLVAGGGVLLSYRGRGSEAVKHAAGWLAFALFLLVLYTYRGEFAELGRRVVAELVPSAAIVREQTAAEPRTVTIRADRSGQFRASVRVNGAPLAMMVDTGATSVVLTVEDAQRAGIDTERLSFSVIVNTANGKAKAAALRLAEVDLGGIAVRNVDALVALPGRLTHSLLGMSYLRRIGGFEVRSDALVLHARPG